MIIFDTNIISESLQPSPNLAVLQWIEQHDDHSAITSITAAELLFGASRRPEGRRQDLLLKGINQILSEFHSKRAILPFDLLAAEHYASISAHRESIGHPISIPDAQIAAICLSHGATLATRNSKDFKNLGLAIQDPWEE